jgi:hypothetical protein
MIQQPILNVDQMFPALVTHVEVEHIIDMSVAVD